MNIRLLAIVLLLALLAAAGCKSSNKVQYNMVDPNTVTVNDFSSTLTDWTSRLDAIAGKTKGLYNDWASGKMKTQDFKNKTVEINQEIKTLNSETDYKSFNLSDRDKKKVNYETIYKGYLKASKDVNDFLEYVPHLNDEKITDKYKELLGTKYDGDISDLKKNLDVQ